MDTGAPITTLDTEMVRQLDPTMLGAAAGSPQEVETLGKIAIDLGGQVFRPKRILVLDVVERISRHLGLPVHGIIGSDVIRDTVLRLDYEHQTVALCNPEEFRYDGHGAVVPLVVRDYIGTLVTVKSFDQEARGAFLTIDTGDNSTLELSGQFATRIGSEKAPSVLIDSTSLTDSGQERMFRIEQMTIGSMRLDRLPAVEGSGEPSDRIVRDGVIGGNVLERFTTIFDYSRRRMILEPNGWYDRAFFVRRSGMSIVARGNDWGEVVVEAVRQGSPAATCGIRSEDVIVGIDGFAGAALDLARVYDVLENSVKRSVAIVVLRDGRRVSVELELKESL